MEKGAISKSKTHQTSATDVEAMYQKLKTRNISPLNASTLVDLFQRRLEIKEALTKQKDTDEYLQARLKKVLDIGTTVNSYETEVRQNKALADLNDLKREKEEKIANFVKLKDETEELLARQAQEYCIEQQVEKQKMIEDAVPDEDPKKEALKLEVQNQRDLIASLDQELKAKNRSLQRFQEEIQKLEEEVQQAKKKLVIPKNIDTQIIRAHEKKENKVDLQDCKRALPSSSNNSKRIKLSPELSGETAGFADLDLSDNEDYAGNNYDNSSNDSGNADDSSDDEFIEVE